ncbi:MAG TPA: IS66 family transposase [Terriglobia bacterium]|nr:IS66 family transposase [Terriglobia bacterium]
MHSGIERLDATPEELDSIVERARPALDEPGYQKLKAAIRTLGAVNILIQNQETTIESLRNLLCASQTEKTTAVLKRSGIDTGQPPKAPRPKPPGHGRHGAKAYRGAHKIAISHATLKSGDGCPDCQRGKVYVQREPGVLVRLVGQAPLDATVYQLEKLRCNLCGEIFTAKAPDQAGDEKYDPTAASMIAVLRYGGGFPMARLEKLEQSLGIPLPASMQWTIVCAMAAQIRPVFEELIRQAAQGSVLHNDDTSMTVLSLRRQIQDEADEPGRTGIFTSGIVSTRDGRHIALFFTGRQHAGENLAVILAKRVDALEPPIQMCDALARNLPKMPQTLEVIVSHCIAHARRRFVEVIPNFPDACRYVLEALGKVYRHDALARNQKLTADQRLLYHRQHSGPVMDQLQKWLTAQLEEKKVEPNSGLGGAIGYLLKYWDRLTLFLRQPGAPLDNNLCERGLKKAILHRKNSLFYKTEKGAEVGDLFMSLVHTAELCGANPFDYLTQLQRHADELEQRPQEWMPWNYLETLRRASPAADTG